MKKDAQHKCREQAMTTDQVKFDSAV